MHAEAADGGAARPFVLLMLRPPNPVRRLAHKYKLLAAFFALLLLVQYLFGASIFHFDYNVYYHYWVAGSAAAAAASVTTTRAAPTSTKAVVVRRVGATNASRPPPPPPLTVDTAGLLLSSASAADVNDSRAVPSESGRMSSQSNELPLCPVVPPVLVGPIRVWFDYPSFEELAKLYPYLEDGGHGKPKDCRARHRVAIIIPYRDREKQLRCFLHNLHSLLTKQQLDYAIFIVEQVRNQTFNRAKLMNIGVVEARKMYDWQCFIFHDVDLLPEDDRNLYTCPEQPRHMSVAVDKFGYKLPYSAIFGGITALTDEQLSKVNGYSNGYWGWGGEDDDMSTRVGLAGFHISRYPANIARYKMIKHSHEDKNPVNKCRYKLMYKTKTRWKTDGLSDLKYLRIERETGKLYTRVRVDLLEDESRAAMKALGC